MENNWWKTNGYSKKRTRFGAFKEKLEELSRVMNNEKLMDIIKNNFSDFTDKEIKDVDIVRERFNNL